MPLETLIESFTLIFWYQLRSYVQIAHLDVLEEGVAVTYVNAPPGYALSTSHHFLWVIGYIQVVFLVQRLLKLSLTTAKLQI